MLTVSTTVEGSVIAVGPTYGSLDGCQFTRREEQDEVAWSIVTPSNSQIEIQEGENSRVVIDGVTMQEDLIPEPWGLLMAFNSPDLHLLDAIPGTMRSTSVGVDTERIDFTTEFVDVSILVSQHWVVEKVIRVDKAVRDRVALYIAN